VHIFLIRHGETVANSEKRYLGHTDSPLTYAGLKQAKELAVRLLPHNPESIFHSDLSRAKITAMPLIKRLAVPVFIDSRLRELSFGLIEGLNYNQAMEAYAKDMKEWYDDFEHKAPPGGETLAIMRERIFSFISELAEMPFRSAALFTHGGVCKLLIANSTGKPFNDVVYNLGQMTEMQLKGYKDNCTLRMI